MKIIIFCLLMVLPFISKGQLKTIIADGNWSNSGIWNGGLIGDNSSEDVDMNNNIDVIIQGGESFTIGDPVPRSVSPQTEKNQLSNWSVRTQTKDLEYGQQTEIFIQLFTTNRASMGFLKFL